MNQRIRLKCQVRPTVTNIINVLPKHQGQMAQDCKDRASGQQARQRVHYGNYLRVTAQIVVESVVASQPLKQ